MAISDVRRQLRELVRRKPLGVATATVLGLALLAGATASPVVQAAEKEALQAALQRYRQAIEKVCETGVTPEMVRLYEATVKAADEARYGRGRDSNFWGPKNPTHAWLDCVQADGSTQR